MRGQGARGNRHGAGLVLFTPMYDLTEHTEQIAAELIPAPG